MKLGYDTTIYAARSGSDDYLWSFLVDFVRIITSESFSRMTNIDFPFRHSLVCFACFCNISLEKRVQAGGEKLNIEASDKISSNSCHALMLAGIKARIQRREKKAKRSKKIHHLFHSSVSGLRDNSVISLRKRLKWMNSFSPDLLLQVHPHRDWVSGIHPQLLRALNWEVKSNAKFSGSGSNRLFSKGLSWLESHTYSISPFLRNNRLRAGINGVCAWIGVGKLRWQNFEYNFIANESFFKCRSNKLFD